MSHIGVSQRLSGYDPHKCRNHRESAHVKSSLLIQTPGLNYQETGSHSNVAPWLWRQSDMMAQWLRRQPMV